MVTLSSLILGYPKNSQDEIYLLPLIIPTVELAVMELVVMKETFIHPFLEHLNLLRLLG
jgi:hypothetical protein